MDWPASKLSASQIDAFGAKLRADIWRNSEEFAQALEARSSIARWRFSHGYAMNTFQANLRTCARDVTPDSFVVQRLKRYSSIESKLRKKNSMRLSQMQDIAGLRAVLPDVAHVRRLQSAFENKKFRHKLLGIDDYYVDPPSSGYRSVHLKYAYDNPRAPDFKGMRLEIQLRTKLQHAWAMAVETIDHIVRTDIKGGIAPAEWLDFFGVIGATFAHKERLTPLSQYANADYRDLVQRSLSLADELQVGAKLKAMKLAAGMISFAGMKGIRDHQLVTLDLENGSSTIQSYVKSMIAQARDDYLGIEERQRNGERITAVLVSAESISSLKSAYASFFMNSDAFLDELTALRAHK